MKRNHTTRWVYTSTAVICLFTVIYGYMIWQHPLSSPGQTCYFVALFGVPCAACGGSHAIQALFNGQWWDAFKFNPLVALSYFSMGGVSMMLIVDFVFRKNILFDLFLWLKGCLKIRTVSYTIAMLLAIHWFIIILKYMKA